MRNKSLHPRHGITNLETTLAVSALFFILVAIIRVLNAPEEQFADARNARRWEDASALLQAVLLKQTDLKALVSGALSAPLQTEEDLAQVVVSADDGIDCGDRMKSPACPPVNLSTAPGTGCVANLAELVPKYLNALPSDPRGEGYTPAAGGMPFGIKNSGYYIHRDRYGRVEIGSCWPERGMVIVVKR
ncbi:MAG: hypothetical protein PHT12_03835 [Patescibacteria group bacterium]|nr:hypothetical protein [Patescibacteria group bacterium]